MMSEDQTQRTELPEDDPRSGSGPQRGGAQPWASLTALRRSSVNRILAGVCGGLGEYFAIDATFIRLVLVLLAFAGGVGLLAYVVLWILMPESGQADSSTSPAPAAWRVTDPARAREMLGVLLIVLGGLFLLANLGLIALEWRLVWPLVLIGIGVFILLRRR